MSGRQRNEVSQEFALNETIRADAIEKSGRRDNVRIFGEIEVSGEDVYQKVVDYAQKANVAIVNEDISVSHTLPTHKPLRKTIIANFVRRYQKLGKKANKKLEGLWEK